VYKSLQAFVQKNQTWALLTSIYD